MPELPLTRAQMLAAGAAAFALLVVLARLLLPAGAAEAGGPVGGGGVALEAAAAPEVVVHVVGAVRSPGLYKLRHGARIADALERAGGATEKADLALVNLAAPVSDGQQVIVAERAPPPPEGGAAAPASPAAPPPRVQLNTATLEQLDALPGIGPVTAQKILDHRQQHGAFSSVDELAAIPGIGPKRLEQLRELVVP